MNRPHTYRTEAVVLRGYDYGEADRILSLFTPNDGKVRVIAKGVRKTKSRKAGHLDLFTRSIVFLARGRELDLVTQAETLESYAPMRSDLWRSTRAHYVAELVDSFSADRLPNYSLYAVTVSTLRRIATGDNHDMVIRSFELQLLALTGYRPQLHRCLSCENSIRPEPNHFSARLGGVLCPECAGDDAAAPVISVRALKAMRHLQTDEAAFLRVRDVGEDVQREMEKCLQEYIVFRLERRPRSVEVMDQLRSEGIT